MKDKLLFVAGIAVGACICWQTIYTMNTNAKINRIALAHDNLVAVLQKTLGDKPQVLPAPTPVPVKKDVK